MSLPRPPSSAFLKTPFLTQAATIPKMDLVSCLMVSCPTPSRPQSSGIGSLGQFSAAAPWDSSRNSYGCCWLPLQACRCLRLLKAVPSGKAELSSLTGMAPSLCVPRGSSGGTDPRQGCGWVRRSCLSLQQLGTPREGSPWRRRQLHVHALAHTHLFPAKHIWRLLYVTCLLRFVAFSWRWWVRKGKLWNW